MMTDKTTKKSKREKEREKNKTGGPKKINE